MILDSWGPEGGWLTLLVVAVGLAAVIRAPSASSSPRTLAGGALTVASVGMLVVAVFANREPPA